MSGGAVKEVRHGGDVEKVIPDGDADPRRARRAATTERAVGEVLNRKSAPRHIGGGNEAFQRRVVGLIDYH